MELKGYTFKLFNANNNQTEDILYEDLFEQVYEELLPQLDSNTCSDYRGLFDVGYSGIPFPIGTTIDINTNTIDHHLVTDTEYAIEDLILFVSYYMGDSISWRGGSDFSHYYLYYESNTINVVSVTIEIPN